MKTKQYLEKYGLSSTNKFDHGEFVKDLSSELLGLLELNKALDNIKGFDNAVRCVRMKFDAISNKTVGGGLPEPLWSYFYATVIVKLREEMCPKEMAARKAAAQARKEAYERKKSFYDGFFDDLWSRQFLAAIFASKSAPEQEYAILGLTTAATSEEIMSAYRKLILTAHPDRGGSQDEFIKITEAKNVCLAWVQH